MVDDTDSAARELILDGIRKMTSAVEVSTMLMATVSMATSA